MKPNKHFWALSNLGFERFLQLLFTLLNNLICFMNNDIQLLSKTHYQVNDVDIHLSSYEKNLFIKGIYGGRGRGGGLTEPFDNLQLWFPHLKFSLLPHLNYLKICPMILLLILNTWSWYPMWALINLRIIAWSLNPIRSMFDPKFLFLNVRCVLINLHK